MAGRIGEHFGSARLNLMKFFVLSLIVMGTLVAEAQPTLIGSPVIVVDLTTGGGRTVLNFQNDSSVPLKVTLSAGILTQIGSSKTSDAAITFSPENDTGSGQPSYPFTLQPAAMARVQAAISNVWDPGQFEADLKNQAIKIGKLKVSLLPMSVKLDSATPDKADFSWTDGVPASINFKNDNPAPYDLSYRLIVAAREIAARDFTIGPNGAARLEFTPSIPVNWYNPEWYFARFQDLFKADAHEGDVLLLYLRQPNRPPDLSSPVKKFPVTATLNFFKPGSRQILSYIIIIFVLTMGGITSLVLSYLLPNRLQRLNMMEKLEALARTTANLSTHVGSKLGVLMRVERSRLYDLLTSRTTISPDFLNIIAQCKDGVSMLSSRVAMLQQMDSVKEQFSDLLPLGSPPTVVYQIEASLDKAGLILGKSEPTSADLLAAQAAITDAANGVNAIVHPTTDFGQNLAQRVHETVTEIQTNFANRPTFVRITRAVPGPWAILQSVPAAAITIDVALYTSVDMAVAKVLLLREYVLLAEGTNDAAMLARLAAAEPSLQGYLQLDHFEALRSARLLLREMQGDVYPQRLRDAVVANPPEAAISMDPPFAYERQPLKFTIQFSSHALDTSAAREEWTCDWDFGDGLSERGWTVSHYFLLQRVPYSVRRQRRVFTVGVTFQDGDGHRIVANGNPVRITRDIAVSPSTMSRLLGERTITEAMRLAAALLIAVFGLFAGAKDQLSKLDVLPGLVAVFLVGFGADTIKNLLTSK
jgi:hypothetical protein